MRWIYNGHSTQWEAAFGGWRAVVQSLNSHCTWQAVILRRYPPYQKHDRLDFEWPRGVMSGVKTKFSAGAASALVLWRLSSPVMVWLNIRQDNQKGTIDE